MELKFCLKKKSHKQAKSLSKATMMDIMKPVF